MELLKQLKWHFKQEWKRYTGAFFLLITVTLLQLFPAKIIGSVVDLILNNQASTYIILQQVLKIILISATIYILKNLWRILLFGASYNLASVLRIQFCSALLEQDTTFYSKYKNGDLISRISNDIDRVVFATGEGVLTIIDSISLGCSIFTMMCIQTNWKLAFFSLFPMPIMAIIIKKYGNKLYVNFQKSQKYFSYLNNQAQDSLVNIQMIKSFKLEKTEIEKFATAAQNVELKDFEVSKISAKFNPIIYVSIAISNLFAILGGSWLIVKEQLTFGQLTSFILYLGSMAWPILAFSWMFNVLERGNVSWKRINKIKKNIDNKKKNSVILNDLENFNNLYVNIKKFIYPTRTKQSLQKIKFILQKNTTLGICGPTGSGKTTIIRLLQKHFELSSGYIKYNQYNIKNICKKKWRNIASVVNQTPFLFSDTILNNISFGKKEVTMKKIIQAAKLACIHHEIKKLQHGYLTQVGENGIKLSGGQKQRITIARAFFVTAKILILDDPLSSVDYETEYKIINNIYKYTKKNQATIIMTTHRLSILKKFNNIIVLKNGKILQSGGHQKLLSENNWYKKMYNYQKSEK
ncbi:ABC transporter transmembrane domain-containing protein [Buchnera aphidicola]|uniref:Multidrug resistance-like ATP-binding protein MdlA n=1 Tax=Buchnera aphidicola (Cinara strobi) TaxID=1921549 RepID=A0A3B1DLB9_9GAMM|nr:ABC transporter transmembrane domain-containing protein [Buchnera aphidicola]VAX76748.1 Multidrug resistance-like ATP-binding protein MdlA [Buchnera aphidicola (Cinara strobi)]